MSATGSSSTPGEWAASIRRIVEDAEAQHFSGVVRVDVGDEVIHQSAHGFADRAHGIANTVGTQLAIASGLKGCTAIAVLRLVESGTLAMDSTVREVLGDVLALLDPAVDVRSLLTHRSGIPEYCSEPDDDGTQAHVDVAQCSLQQPADIVDVIAGLPMRAEVGAEFRYNNTGYVLLALMAETVTGRTLSELLDDLVFHPAGMQHSALLATDELPGSAAVGYVEPTGLRTNVHLVPRRGLGDGGLYTTVEDVTLLWAALRSGALVTAPTWSTMRTPSGHTPGGTPYGMGLWLDPSSDAVDLEGYDAGISFRSVHQPSRGITWTVISNWTDGAWPVTAQLADLLGTKKPL